jgi:hypothetical protein
MAKKTTTTQEKTPAPAPVKSNVSWDLLEDNTITRTEGGSTITVASLQEKRIVYPDADLRARFHSQVVQFLSDENIEFDTDQVIVSDTPGADLVASENTPEFNASIPAPPRQNIRQGDKTPRYVEWLRDNKPNTFKQKYGVIGKGVVTKRTTVIDPITGRSRIHEYKEEALLSTRKTHLTEKPEAKADTEEFDA